MSALSRKRRAFVARVYYLLDRVPRVAVDGLLMAQGRREWRLARERFETALNEVGLQMPEPHAPKSIDIEELKGRRLQAVVGAPESDPFAEERTAEARLENRLRILTQAGYRPGLHVVAEDLPKDWSTKRCHFHGVRRRRASVRGCSYPFYERVDIERYSTCEHTKAWTAHVERKKAIELAERSRREDDEARRQEFARRKKDGTLITRQEIIANGWRVPMRPDFVEALGRGRVRYYYRLPIEIVLVKRRARREDRECSVSRAPRRLQHPGHPAVGERLDP